MKLSDFHYHLPPELIAQRPLEQRSDSRLLCVGEDGTLADRQFTDIEQLLRPGDLLVFNDTRVIPARLFGHKASGGKVEVLVERVVASDRVLAHVRASKSPKPGGSLLIAGHTLQVVGRDEALFELQLLDGDFTALMQAHGHMPLPPYIERPDEAFDAERYQTVFGERPGAVAAPTAGLHFDQPLLDRLQATGIEFARLTLHVGAGTFQPVRVQNLDDHRMHAERVIVPPSVVEQVQATRRRGGRVVAVGTTSVRSLESAAAAGELAAFDGETRLFIRPGYRFRVVDALITNFHLPESTLLMLVSAFAGVDEIRAAYAHAVAQRYRFFSYGDAMWLARKE